MTIPNLITIARLIAVPGIVLLLLDGEFPLAFAVFVLAGISDAVDGTIARWVPGQASELGRYLDPVADKALLVSVFVTLAVVGPVPVWLVVLVVSRDVLIVGGVMMAWVLANPVPIDPLKVSKANTFAQILLAVVVLADLALMARFETTTHYLVWTVAALTVGSTAAYLIAWVRHMGSRGENRRR